MASRSDGEGASGSKSTRHTLPDAPTETARSSPQNEAAPRLSDRRRGDKAVCSMGESSSGRDDAAPRASCCAPLGHLVLWLAKQNAIVLRGIVALAPVADLRRAWELKVSNTVVEDLLGDRRRICRTAIGPRRQ
jgi:hypothetical protein